MSLLRRLFGFGSPRREAAGQPPAPPPAVPAATGASASAPVTIPVHAIGDATRKLEEAPPAPSRVPAAAVEMVAEFEGFRAEAYLCPAKVWTIGYGTTRWGDGSPVVKGDGPVTQDAARRLLQRDLDAAARAVDDLVLVNLTERQRAALISFVHNVGRGAFARSTMLTHLNAGRLTSAAGEFTRWVHGGGAILPGLMRRRSAEARLFMGRA